MIITLIGLSQRDTLGQEKMIEDLRKIMEEQESMIVALLERLEALGDTEDYLR